MAATSTTPLRDMRKLRVAELREWLKAKEVAYLPRDTKRTLQQIATAYLKAHVTPIDKAKVDGMTDEEVMTRSNCAGCIDEETWRRGESD